MISNDSVPDETPYPFTVIVDSSASASGVTVIEFTEYGTSTEYEVVSLLNPGESVPLESESPERFAFISEGRFEFVEDPLREHPPAMRITAHTNPHTRFMFFSVHMRTIAVTRHDIFLIRIYCFFSKSIY